ncbi:MAG: hypothetical protein VB066_01845 [Paludibacter sp.]|nr:hypothetical protein [Paludibacter sp.]
MIIGYKPQFPTKILAGIKKHTLREDRHDRWHAGMKMHQSAGVRTKKYKLLRLDTCTGTQKVIISIVDKSKNPDSYVCCKKINRKQVDRAFDVIVDNKKLRWRHIVMLAHNDGFDSADEFFKWFFDGFTGKIIHWTDLRY